MNSRAGEFDEVARSVQQVLKGDPDAALLTLRDARKVYPESKVVALAFDWVATAEPQSEHDLVWPVLEEFECAVWESLGRRSPQEALAILDARTSFDAWEPTHYFEWSTSFARLFADAQCGQWSRVREGLSLLRGLADDPSVVEACSAAQSAGLHSVVAFEIATPASVMDEAILAVLGALAQATVANEDRARTAADEALMLFLGSAELRSWIGNPRTI